MAVREYFCTKSNRMIFDVYVHFRSSKDRSIRAQKFQRCFSKTEAERAEKALIRIASSQLKDEENRGSHWSVILQRWESAAVELKRNPTTLKPLSDHARITCLSSLKQWTKEWMNKPCKELSIKDGRELLLATTAEDLAPATIRKLKTYINLVFRFGIQEGLIEDIRTSPVHGVPFDLNDGDALPEILTVDQAKKLLLESKVRENPWFPIWATALMTGMRSSELYALRKENVLIKEGIIRVTESWDWVNDCSKETKAGYWRNAPIASALKPIIAECMVSTDGPFVFPRIAEWTHGEQAQVLREFCEVIGIPSVRFHTLRACFATHLLAMGVDAGTIMAIGGWSNYKTFRIYIRLAGVTERNKTEGLGDVLVPTENSIQERISNAFLNGEMSRIA